jgi:hypothetical protein
MYGSNWNKHDLHSHVRRQIHGFGHAVMPATCRQLCTNDIAGQLRMPFSWSKLRNTWNQVAYPPPATGQYKETAELDPTPSKYTYLRLVALISSRGAGNNSQQRVFSATSRVTQGSKLLKS